MTQNTEFSHSEQRRGRVKMAQAVLNMHALHEEMELYDLSSLQKSASAGRSQEQRIKYAALRFQYELEKQAVIGAVLRAAAKSGLSGLKGLAGKGLKGLKMGYNPAMRVSAGLAGKVAPVTTGTIRGARAGASAAKGVGAGTVGTAKGAFGGARRGAIDAIRQNPKSTAASAGLLGYELLNQGGRGRGRSPSPQAPALPPPVATGGAAGLPLQGSRRSHADEYADEQLLDFQNTPSAGALGSAAARNDGGMRHVYDVAGTRTGIPEPFDYNIPEIMTPGQRQQAEVVDTNSLIVDPYNVGTPVGQQPGGRRYR